MAKWLSLVCCLYFVGVTASMFVTADLHGFITKTKIKK